MLDVWTAAVFLIIIGAVAFLIFKLGPLPGDIAKKRGHPQEEMIRAAGWVLLFVGIVPWLIPFIFAYGKPGTSAAVIAAGAKSGATDVDQLGETQRALAAATTRIEALEQQIASLTTGKGDDA